jgi:MFS family permease
MVWSFPLLRIGVALWGLGIGVQESLIPAIVGKMVPHQRRGSAIGILAAGYGISLFIGGVIIGLLYIVGIEYLVLYGVLAEISAIPIFFAVSTIGDQEKAIH